MDNYNTKLYVARALAAQEKLTLSVPKYQWQLLLDPFHISLGIHVPPEPPEAILLSCGLSLLLHCALVVVVMVAMMVEIRAAAATAMQDVHDQGVAHGKMMAEQREDMCSQECRHW
jgi:hypothetical protein